MSSKLTNEEIRHLQQAAVECALPDCRNSLLAGIDKNLVDGIPVAPNHAAQLLSDLYHLNDAELTLEALNEHGESPVATWLKNAESLTRGRQQEAVFADARMRMQCLPNSLSRPHAPERYPVSMSPWGGILALVTAALVGFAVGVLFRRNVGATKADYVVDELERARQGLSGIRSDALDCTVFRNNIKETKTDVSRLLRQSNLVVREVKSIEGCMNDMDQDQEMMDCSSFGQHLKDCSQVLPKSIDKIRERQNEP